MTMPRGAPAGQVSRQILGNPRPVAIQQHQANLQTHQRLQPATHEHDRCRQAAKRGQQLAKGASGVWRDPKFSASLASRSDAND